MCKDCGCSLPKDTNKEDSHHHHAHPELNDEKTVDVITKILDKNNKEAIRNRDHIEEHGIFAINLMSSPGSGKTTLLETTIKESGFKIGVIEGDLETNKDADRIIKAGAKAHQITTGQACHLDAFMVHEGLHHLPLKDIELLFVENVGNLVCPASYELGTDLNVVLLSVPEGSDKISKYPVMFRKADLIIITKISLLKYFNFNLDEVKREAKKLNPKVDIIALDSTTKEGFDKWIDYLKLKMELR